MITADYSSELVRLAASPVLTTSRRRFTFSRKSLWRRGPGSRAEQSHVTFVCEQFILQLHVEGFTLDVLHLRVDIR